MLWQVTPTITVNFFPFLLFWQHIRVLNDFAIEWEIYLVERILQIQPLTILNSNLDELMPKKAYV